MARPLVLLCGLPGTGKSAIATAIASRLGFPVVAKDIVEAALLRSGVGPEQGSGWAAYEVLIDLARAQLAAGVGVVVDSVASTERLRAEFAAAAAAHDAPLLVIECVCGDVTLHRTRLDGRRRGIPGWPELTWSDVEDVRQRYDRPGGPDLRLDAVDALEANIDAAVALVRCAVDGPIS